jgi:hypothetical protein
MFGRGSGRWRDRDPRERKIKLGRIGPLVFQPILFAGHSTWLSSREMRSASVVLTHSLDHAAISLSIPVTLRGDPDSIQ